MCAHTLETDILFLGISSLFAMANMSVTPHNVISPIVLSSMSFPQHCPVPSCPLS